MTLDLARQAQQVRARQRLAEERVAGDKTGNRRGGRRAEPAGKWDLVVHLDPPADPLGDLATDLAEGEFDPLDAAVLTVLG